MWNDLCVRVFFQQNLVSPLFMQFLLHARDKIRMRAAKVPDVIVPHFSICLNLSSYLHLGISRSSPPSRPAILLTLLRSIGVFQRLCPGRLILCLHFRIY